eukprot:gene3115-1455_t
MSDKHETPDDAAPALRCQQYDRHSTCSQPVGLDGFKVQVQEGW